jgi:hypothetical protein
MGGLSGDRFRRRWQQQFVLIPFTCPLRRKGGDEKYEMHEMHVAGDSGFLEYVRKVLDYGYCSPTVQYLP